MHIVHDPAAPAADELAFDAFLKIDIRAGTIREAAAYPEARNPSYRLLVDLGPGIGLKKSIAQVTQRHALADLPGSRVMAVVNFPPRQIGPALSEVLLLGMADADGAVILVSPDPRIPDGARLS